MFYRIKNKVIEQADWALASGERILGLDVRYFLKGGFYQFSTYALLTVLGFLISIFMARIWDKVTFGKWQLVVSIVNTLIVFSLIGMNSSIAVAAAKGADKSLITGIKARMRWSLLGSIGLIVTAGYFWFFRKDVAFTHIFLILSVLFPFYASFDSVVAFFNAKKEFLKSSAMQLGSKIILAATIISLLFFYNNFPLIVIINYAIIGLFNFFVFLAMRRSISGKDDPNTVPFGFKMSIANLLPSVTAYADKLIIPFFLDVQELATYIIALSVPDLFNAAVKPLHALLFPKVAELDRKGFVKMLHEKWLLTALLPLGFFLVAIALSFAIPIIFGEKYASAMPFSIIMSISMIFMIFFSLVYNFMISQEMSKQILQTQSALSLLRIILLVILVPKFGLLGASIVYALNMPLFGFLGYFLIRREMR